MQDNDGRTDFGKAVEPILRRFIENIESPFVWMPLGLFILCVLAYPITQFSAYLYLSLGFLLLSFGADWVGRWRNRQAPAKPTPQESSYREGILRYLAGVQAKAVAMLESGKPNAARALTDKNLQAVDEALKAFPDDADFHSLLGYTLKDVFQTSKGLLSAGQRRAYLDRARKSFDHALRLDPNNPSAHNGMGNVFFFEGRFDEALKEHDKALKLAGGNYPEAEHDRHLVISAKKGEIPPDF